MNGFKSQLDLHNYLAILKLAFSQLSFIFPKSTLLIFTPLFCSSFTSLLLSRENRNNHTEIRSSVFLLLNPKLTNAQSFISFHLASKKEGTFFTSKVITLYRIIPLSLSLQCYACPSPTCHLQSPVFFFFELSLFPLQTCLHILFTLFKLPPYFPNSFHCQKFFSKSVLTISTKTCVHYYLAFLSQL